ncbi:MAG: adenylosuccinate lyase, partial [Candidatus Altiarchaeota archaeon]|nr:adenylosuccinate lyase [Candidatus Altiarchaeota archaeon]
ERICGLSRIIKADAIVALDNIPLWHERDLTNSAPERIIIPEACVLIDYILRLSIKVLSNLVFKYENIEKNLNMSKGLIMAENVMVKLVDKGMGRQEAHELARKCAMEVYDTGKDFYSVLSSNKEIKKYLSDTELKAALKPENYIGTAVEQVDRVIRELK